MRVAMTHWRSAGEEASLAVLLTAALDVLADGLTAPARDAPITAH
jgi:hypothetical protein